MMKKNIWCMILVFVLISMSLTFVFSEQYMQFPEKIGVETNKVWTIKLNKWVDAETVNEDNIYLTTGSSAIKLNGFISVEVDPEDKSQIIVSPKTQWEEGGSYTLNISNIKSSRGQELLSNVRMYFTTLRSGQHRIELEWGELPYDLDLQLYVRTNTKDYHLIHATNREVAGIAKLDVDVVTGYGIETILIENIRNDYLYTVVVTQNTYEVPLSDSNAVVRIYDVDGLIMEREVPIQLRPDLWGVAQWRNGNLVPIEISY